MDEPVESSCGSLLAVRSHMFEDDACVQSNAGQRPTGWIFTVVRNAPRRRLEQALHFGCKIAPHGVRKQA